MPYAATINFNYKQMEKVKAAIRPLIQWDEAYRAALATQGIDSQGKFPPIDWRIRSLMAEHSQVKLVEFHLSLKNLMQFVGVHLIRHPYLLPFIKLGSRKPRSL